MTALTALQTAFQERVLHGSRSIEPLVAGDANDVIARLGIYERAYRARLIEALGVSYPVLQKVLGPGEFGRVAASCVRRGPPTHPSIRWFGADLHLGLCAMHAELARWEWLLAEVFDAGDGAAMTEADLAHLAPADWPAHRLRLHRTVRRFESTTNAVGCWKAAMEGGPPPAPVDTAPGFWVLWRRDLTILFRSTPPHETRALALLAQGVSIAELCTGLARDMDAQEAAVCAATLLKQWIGEGMIGRQSS